MNVNKKFDRLRQWGRERMGGEVATNTTDEFKALELEMELRHQGMERVQASTNSYIKSLSKRDPGDGKEKVLPVAHFGATLATHGDDFEPDSEFGQCLAGLGRANERIARMQETYCANATGSWLESCERSMIQLKEYQAARKKLDSRRLAFDTQSAKMQKSKREDFRMEEELRSQKAKYEESQEEVYRRMLDIKEAEQDSVADLSTFLEAELAYYDRAREVLMQLKRDWPATTSPTTARSTAGSPTGLPRRPTRSRASSIRQPDDPEPPTMPYRHPSSSHPSPRRELPGFDLTLTPTTSHTSTSHTSAATLNLNSHGAARPRAPSRTSTQPTLPTTFEASSSTPTARDLSPAPSLASSTGAGMPRLTRVPTDPHHLLGAQRALRSTGGGGGGAAADVFADGQGHEPPPGTGGVRSNSYSNGAGVGVEGAAGMSAKKAPPPPPPSRAKKPPPPPPVKRGALGT